MGTDDHHLVRTKRARRLRPRRVSGAQRLYDACKFAFAGGGSSSHDAVERVEKVVESMACSDFGLDDKLCGGVMESQNVISYLHIFESRNFSIGIFCLPPSAEMPLHDHPGMTVFSKLLCGSVHLKSFDWAKPTQEQRRPGAAAAVSSFQIGILAAARLAKLVRDDVLTAPCASSVLHPESGGNIHSLTAITACAVLDVLAPPYGTRFSYYTELPAYQQQQQQLIPPCSSLPAPVDPLVVAARTQSSSHAWLQEFPGAVCNIKAPTSYKSPRILK